MVNAKGNGPKGVAQGQCELLKLLGPSHIIGVIHTGSPAFMNSDMGSISWKSFREGFLCPNKPSGTETVGCAGLLSYRFLDIQASRAHLLVPLAIPAPCVAYVLSAE